MGKKTRKTRWRTLAIADESDSEESNTLSGSQLSKSYQHRPFYSKFTYSSQSTPTRRFPYEPKSTRSSSTASETKITFNEDEYTKITTPRQDVLFKKGYLNKPKNYQTQTSTGNSTASTGNSTGNGTPDHQSADGTEGTDLEYESQFVFPNAFVDQNGIYYINSYEHYPLLMYNPTVCYPEYPSSRTKRHSTGSLTESTSPHTEETSQDLSQSGGENTGNRPEYNHVYNVVYPGYYFSGVCSPNVTINGQAATEPRKIKKKRRRKVSKTINQEDSTSEDGYSSDEAITQVENRVENTNSIISCNSSISTSETAVCLRLDENAMTKIPEEGKTTDEKSNRLQDHIEDNNKTTSEITHPTQHVDEKSAKKESVLETTRISENNLAKEPLEDETEDTERKSIVDTNADDVNTTPTPTIGNPLNGQQSAQVNYNDVAEISEQPIKESKFNLNAEEFIPRAFRSAESLPVDSNLQFINIHPNFVPLPLINHPELNAPSFNPPFLPPGIPINFMPTDPKLLPNFINFVPNHFVPVKSYEQSSNINETKTDETTKENNNHQQTVTVETKTGTVTVDSCVNENPEKCNDKKDETTETDKPNSIVYKNDVDIAKIVSKLEEAAKEQKIFENRRQNFRSPNKFNKIPRQRFNSPYEKAYQNDYKPPFDKRRPRRYENKPNINNDVKSTETADIQTDITKHSEIVQIKTKDVQTNLQIKTETKAIPPKLPEDEKRYSPRHQNYKSHNSPRKYVSYNNKSNKSRISDGSYSPSTSNYSESLKKPPYGKSCPRFEKHLLEKPNTFIKPTNVIKNIEDSTKEVIKVTSAPNKTSQWISVSNRKKRKNKSATDDESETVEEALLEPMEEVFHITEILETKETTFGNTLEKRVDAKLEDEQRLPATVARTHINTPDFTKYKVETALARAGEQLSHTTSPSTLACPVKSNPQTIISEPEMQSCASPIRRESDSKSPGAEISQKSEKLLPNNVESFIEMITSKESSPIKICSNIDIPKNEVLQDIKDVEKELIKESMKTELIQIDTAKDIPEIKLSESLPTELRPAKDSTRKKSKKSKQKCSTKRIIILDPDISRKEDQTEEKSKQTTNILKQEEAKPNNITEVSTRQNTKNLNLSEPLTDDIPLENIFSQKEDVKNESLLLPLEISPDNASTPDKKKSKKKKKQTKSTFTTNIPSISSSSTTLNNIDDSYDFLLDTTALVDEKTNIEVSEELDKMIQKGLFGNLEEKFKSLNVSVDNDFFKSLNIKPKVQSSQDKGFIKATNFTTILNSTNQMLPKSKVSEGQDKIDIDFSKIKLPDYEPQPSTSKTSSFLEEATLEVKAEQQVCNETTCNMKSNGKLKNKSKKNIKPPENQFNPKINTTESSISKNEQGSETLLKGNETQQSKECDDSTNNLPKNEECNCENLLKVSDCCKDVECNNINEDEQSLEMKNIKQEEISQSHDTSLEEQKVNSLDKNEQISSNIICNGHIHEENHIDEENSNKREKELNEETHSIEYLSTASNGKITNNNDNNDNFLKNDYAQTEIEEHIIIKIENKCPKDNFANNNENDESTMRQNFIIQIENDPFNNKDFSLEPNPSEKSPEGICTKTSESTKPLYPITQAVREWMTKTRETTPEVEILKSPDTIYKEFIGNSDEEDSDTETDQKNVESNPSSVEYLDQGEICHNSADVRVANADSEDEITVFETWSMSQDTSTQDDLLDCWEPEIPEEHKEISENSKERKDSIEQGEDVLEIYESKYGKNEDFLRLKAEIEEQRRNGNFPKHGNLPYRAICCSLM